MARPTRTPLTTTGLPALGSTTRALIPMATKPNRQSHEYGAWIEQEDFLPFLRDERQRDEVVLYAGLTHCFLYGIAVPSSAVSPIDVYDLLGWSCNPFASWGLCRGYREGASERQMWIEPPLNSCGSTMLGHEEQLLFMREFDGHRDDRTTSNSRRRLRTVWGCTSCLNAMPIAGWTKTVMSKRLCVSINCQMVAWSRSSAKTSMCCSRCSNRRTSCCSIPPGSILET